jgi:hypothetical protein
MLKRKYLLGLISLVLLLALFVLVILPVGAQTDEITWDPPFNISDTPKRNSTDPFILGDPDGGVHLFWAEKTGTTLGDQADTLMYAHWDGEKWSTPVDIFITPTYLGNQVLIFPHAVMDDQGYIHLIWIEEPNFPNYALYYSSVYAPLAGQSSAWKDPVPLAQDLSGTEYSLHIAYEAPSNLHVIYARVPQGDTPPDERAVGYTRSTDNGATWSDPVDLYSTPDPTHGASNTRLLVVPPGKVYATWTEWDKSGNGKYIYFTGSEDSGVTWSKPIQVAEKIGTEYERDWNNMVYLDGQGLMTMYEGGWRAYRYARYSNDGGKTWSDPVDTFPWLIGENGFAEFVKDSLGRVHVFLAQRVREDDTFRQKAEGMWHSVWEGGTRWREPTLMGGFNYMVNPKVAIVGGNRIVAVWYTPPIFEINVMTGVITDAPAVPVKPWPEPTSAPPQPSAIPSALVPTGSPAQATDAGITPTSPIEEQPPSGGSQASPGFEVLMAVIPAVIVIAGLILFKKYFRGG